MNIVGIDTERPEDEGMAKEILCILVAAYPGHSWFVVIRGGVVQVKNTDWSSEWGMVLHYSQIKADASERKRSVLRAAGEFLERAHIIRGAKVHEQHVAHIEGVPDRALARALI